MKFNQYDNIYVSEWDNSVKGDMDDCTVYVTYYYNGLMMACK